MRAFCPSAPGRAGINHPAPRPGAAGAAGPAKSGLAEPGWAVVAEWGVSTAESSARQPAQLGGINHLVPRSCLAGLMALTAQGQRCPRKCTRALAAGGGTGFASRITSR